MKVFSLACLTAVAFAFAIGFGYVFYVLVLGFEAYPIPTISRTWTFRPSNFISRQVVIPGSVALMVIHTAIYYAMKDAPGASLFLFIALIANTFLAVVSAICMDDFSAECLGSVKLHDGFAVAYFALIDLWMVGMQVVVSHKKKQSVASAHWMLRSLFCCLGLVANVAVAFPTTGSNFNMMVGRKSGMSLGEFEWLNVSTILLFTISFVYEHVLATQVGILHLNDPVAPVHKGNTRMEALLSITNGPVTIGAIALCAATIGLAYSVALSRGDFQPLPHVPEVSDLFVLPPGNSYAHFFGILGCTLLSIVVFQFSYAYRAWAQRPSIPLVSSLIGVLCLSMSLCVSKVEDTDLHFFFVSGFFAWFQSFMLWTTFITRKGAVVPKESRSWMHVTALCSLLSKARFAIWDLEPFAVGELLDVIVIVVFIGSFAWFHANELNQHPFALFNVIEHGNADADEDGLWRSTKLSQPEMV